MRVVSLRQGFSLLEVMCATLILAVAAVGFISALSENNRRIFQGDDVEILYALAHERMYEIADAGYPQDLVPVSDWEEFQSIHSETKFVYAEYRWRYSVEEHETPQWAEEEGSERDDGFRYEENQRDLPYRVIIIEVQKFDTDDYGAIMLESPSGDPLILERVMKPEPPQQTQQEGSGAR